MKFKHGWAFPDGDEFMINELKDDGTYQSSHLDRALAFVTDHTVAIDGGAHVGTWSRRLSPHFDRIIAVEPSTDTFEALTHNMATFECGNVECRQVAIGASHGRVNLILDGKFAAIKNTGARYMKRDDAQGAVPLEPIDAWQLPSLGFLKLDVEGAECLALQGARDTLRRCRPIVLFEDKGWWKRFDQPRQAPHTFLSSIGYRHVLRVSMDEIWGPIER